MALTRNRIEKNLAEVRRNIADACARAGRDPDDVTLVAVSKSADIETIRNMAEAGLTELGENHAQQLAARAQEIAAWVQRRRTPLPSPVNWHMIGHLQRNKVKAVLDVAKVIHSVDSLRLAEELNKRAAAAEKVVSIMLEVNCSEEPQKHGCAVGAAGHLADLVCTLKNLELIGLMTMAPVVDDPEKARPTFVRLREIFEDMRRDKMGGEHFGHLSMGMSQDYAVAVEEGATIVRVGSALLKPA